jgi:two-component system, LuxR family, response regulator FixJ
LSVVPEPASPLVYVIDDDASIRDALALVLGLSGYSTRLFPDAESFLAVFDDASTGCVVADLRLPGLSGLELQDEIRRRRSRIPFVIITAHGDVPAARAAFRAQAVDFIEKPFDDVQLRAAIEAAFEAERHRTGEDVRRKTLAEKLSRLTAREREVLRHAAKGLHAKEIGDALGISSRTVEVHKTRIMEKLKVRNIGELVRFALLAEDDS